MAKSRFDDLELEKAFQQYWVKEISLPDLQAIFYFRYRDRIDASIRSRGISDRNTVEELTSRVVERIIQKNHLEKYDPKRSRFSTHIFTVINSIVVNRYRRSTTDPLAAQRASSILPGSGPSSEKGGYIAGVVYAERLDSGSLSPKAQSIESQVLTAQIYRALEDRMVQGYVWSGPVQKRALKKDETVQNTLWQVFIWLYMEDPPFCTRTVKERHRDIADFLGVTPGSVTNWKRRIREEAAEVFESLGLEDLYDGEFTETDTD